MPLTGSTNEQKIWNYLKGKLGNACGAAGLMGNLYAESALDPQNLQNSYQKKLGYTDEAYTAAVDNGNYTNFVRDSAGYGLAQWTYWSRKQNLYKYAKNCNASIGDLEMQLDFLTDELSASYKSVLTVLKAATSVRSASDAVLLQFEKPADQSEAVKKTRASYGQAYYDKYAGNTAAASSTGGNQNMADYSKYINSTGTHYISNSGSDENGTYHGGTAGDQTAKEWRLMAWYNRPWKCVLRHPNESVREKLAELACSAALNDKIGYDQYQRQTYWVQLQAAGYDPAKITTACEADCSAGVCANIKAAGHLLGIAALQNHTATYTGNMRTALKAAGFQVLTDSKYLTDGKYLLPGDILLNDSCHTATNITKGAKASAATTATTSSGSGSSGNTSYSGKGIGTATAKRTMNIRAGAGTSYKSYGSITKGTAVEVLEILSSGWYKIVWTGASCGYAYTSNTGGKYYTYAAKTSAATTSTKVEPAQSFDKTIAGTYTVTASALYMRSGAGTDKAILATIKNGASVKNYGYYTAFNGAKWLYVSHNGQTGFCSSKYLKKQ